MSPCDDSYVESLCGGKSLLIGTGCSCIPVLVEKYSVTDVITLYESWECDLHQQLISEAKRGRFNLYHLPVQDFTINPLRHILEAVRIAAWLLARGASVLVSCYGGCGRTGTVITLFNIVYRCMGFEEALEHYYKRRGCGPESPDQETLLYEAARIASNMGCKPLVSRDACNARLRIDGYDPEAVLKELEYLSPV